MAIGKQACQFTSSASSFYANMDLFCIAFIEKARLNMNRSVMCGWNLSAKRLLGSPISTFSGYSAIFGLFSWTISLQ